MKTESEIKARIKKLETDYEHVLTGSVATLQINAPRALSQISAETTLATLYWFLDKEYKTKLKGIDR